MQAGELCLMLSSRVICCESICARDCSGFSIMGESMNVLTSANRPVHHHPTEMKKSLLTLRIALMLALFIAPIAGAAENPKLDGVPVRNTGHYAIVDTDRGDIVLELYAAEAPKTVANLEN